MTGGEIAMIGLAVASAAASAYTTYQAGEAQAQASKYNARVAENQGLAAQQAAEVQAENRGEELKRFQATRRAVLGASGSLPGEGTSLLLQMDAVQESERELQQIRYGGQLAATGFQSQAELSRFEGRQARTAGRLGAGATLLTGATGIAGSAYRRRNPLA